MFDFARSENTGYSKRARKRNFVMASIPFLDMLPAEKNPFKSFPDNC